MKRIVLVCIGSLLAAAALAEVDPLAREEIETGNFYGETIVLNPGGSMTVFAGVTNLLYGK